MTFDEAIVAYYFFLLVGRLLSSKRCFPLYGLFIEVRGNERGPTAASLIALRRVSDALVSSTFFSISLCIMLGVTFHALSMSSSLNYLFYDCRMSSRGDTFRVCPSVFKTTCLRTLHPLHSQP